jgi:hypothetical protein
MLESLLQPTTITLVMPGGVGLATPANSPPIAMGVLNGRPRSNYQFVALDEKRRERLAPMFIHE